MNYERTPDERADRAKSMGLTPPEFAEYRDALRKDYEESLYSSSRLLTRLVLAGGWPW